MYSQNIIANVNLNASTYTGVSLEQTNVITVLVQCRTSVDVLIASSSSPTVYFTLKAGISIEIDVNSISDPIFYAKSGSGNVVLEIMGIKRKI